MTTDKTPTGSAGSAGPEGGTAAFAREAAALAADEATASWPAAVRSLLEYGVARTLGTGTGPAQDAPATGPDGPHGDPAERLWALAEQVTARWADGAKDTALTLAVSSLHNACRLLAGQADPGSAESSGSPESGSPESPESAGSWPQRRARLAALVEGGPPLVTVVPGGPLVACGVPSVTDHLGCALDAGPVAALCRCGLSAVKPDCDAECLRSGFDDAKDPARVPSRRDTYVGQQVTILDNRGVCQHSGLCTDRLASVFHSGSEPFVTPSGGRMDEIIRAVRDCPSGALSYAVDGAEARAQTDWGGTRPPAVEITADGPYRVTGSVGLVDGSGTDLLEGRDASTEHYALCRCGHSQNKPFCSGMHYYVQFRDPVPDEERVPSVFEWAGGLPALTRMTRRFYEVHVPADDLIGPLFANMSADHPERVAKWLSEVFGGPSFYSGQFGGYSRMLSQHRGRCLTDPQRTRWVELLMRSAHEVGLPNDPEFRAAFGSYIEWGSRLAFENSQTNSRPPEHMPMPHWNWGTAAGPPGSRISALAPAEPETPAVLTLPEPGEQLSFEAHIKPLFRSLDRSSMLFVFDLWKYVDVRTHAAAILERVRAGTMPCDGTWSADQVAAFERWVDEGTPA